MGRAALSLSSGSTGHREEPFVIRVQQVVGWSTVYHKRECYSKNRRSRPNSRGGQRQKAGFPFATYAIDCLCVGVTRHAPSKAVPSATKEETHLSTNYNNTSSPSPSNASLKRRFLFFSSHSPI